jgi:hypothetical protein
MRTLHKRATVYFDSGLHRALRIKAVETERSLSEIVNDAVKQSLAEDAEDLAAFEERAKEPNLAFEVVLKDLRRRGKLWGFDQALSGERDRGDSQERPRAHRKKNRNTFR